MFDEIERKEKLKNLCFYKVCEIPARTCLKCTEIIYDEKLMIEQAKKEAVKEFAEILYKKLLYEEEPEEKAWIMTTPLMLKEHFLDKLLKEYEVL